MPRLQDFAFVFSLAFLFTPQHGLSQWTAYNDHAPTTLTHSNATTWNILGNPPGPGGWLKNIQTGTDLQAFVNIHVVGTTTQGATAANPLPGTPLHGLFNGFVDFTGGGSPDSAIQIGAGSTAVYSFQGLNPNRKYNFAGSAVRGGLGGDYDQRWTLFQLDGATSFIPVHSPGAYTFGLPSNQVAVNTGGNTNGDMCSWIGIVPAPDGSFSITCTQYTGAIPGGISAAGRYGYAMSGFRLEEQKNLDLAAVLPNGNNYVQVHFTAPIDPASGTNVANYSITNSAYTLSISDAQMVDSHTVQLRCTNFTPYMIYTVSASNIKDAATGAVLLLAQTNYQSIPFTMGYVQRDLFTDIPGGTVPQLKSSPKFPNQPDSVSYMQSSGFPIANINDYYGSRTWGWIVAPVDGEYHFAARADDLFELYLSPDQRPWQKQLVASSTVCCEGYDAHAAGPVTLAAGERIYFELLHKEDTGGDYAYLAWKTPTNSTWGLIPASQLGNYIAPAGSTIALQQYPTNINVNAGQYARFGVWASGSSIATTTLSYQWQKDGEDIPGAYNQFHEVGPCTLSDSGSVYRVLIGVPGRGFYIGQALLSVSADNDPPLALRGYSLGATNVEVVFNEAVDTATATNAANYAMSGGVKIFRAELSISNTVFLVTSPLTYHSNYTLAIANVRDWGIPPNTIAPGASVTFTALPFAASDIGTMPIPTQISYTSNGFNISSAGNEIGGVADHCAFNYISRAGDFDVCVRIAGLSLTDVWAKSGIMARENLLPGSRFAASLSTPAMAGTFFLSRSSANGGTTKAGSFPINFPDQWLRLSRVGNIFTGYASFDGVNWTVLGKSTLDVPSRIYLGTSAASRSTNSLTAQVRDWQDCTNKNIDTVGFSLEPPGPSTRRTALAITEIMYKPAPRSDAMNLEFVELYNSYPYFLDVSNWRITGDKLDFSFPAGTTIPGGAYMVIAAAPDHIRQVYGLPNALAYIGSLGASDNIRVYDEQGSLRIDVSYTDDIPWPLGADGLGHSIVLSRPTLGQRDPRAWTISDRVGGTPGFSEPYRPDLLSNVTINEFLAHTDDPDRDFVELYNHSNYPVDISRCILTDDAATNKFVIPLNTIIPARGFAVFDQDTLRFALSADGETIYLFDPAKSRLLDIVRFDGQENGVSSGRVPDGSSQIYRLSAKTPGTNNATIGISDIVVNELMYHPISGNDDEQFIELHNRTTAPIDIGLWSLSAAVRYRFPSNTVVPTRGYIVVARSITTLLSNYPNLNVFNTLGNFDGRLSGRGERLVLNKPDWIVSTNSAGRVETNRIDIPVVDFTWQTGGRWGRWADGGGSSLELVDPDANPKLPSSWADSDETAKAPWSTIEVTGVLDHGANYQNATTINYAQIGLLEPGECLVDNIEVISALAATNCVLNGTFETGLGNWLLQGCHVTSSLAPQGYSSSRSLHVRATDQMWTGINSCQMQLGPNRLANGTTATLRFRARWLHGSTEPLLRLNGNWLEATGRMSIPRNLGTPGAANSRAVDNTGPAIYDVAHIPALPPANTPVRVTARVHDPDGLQNLTLQYRVDPLNTFTSLQMKDDGTGGDLIARDGTFTATIPGQNARVIVAFNLSASDIASKATRFPALFATNLPPPECLVMFGADNTASTFGAYHLWITKTNADRWTALSDLSNESHDSTVVIGNRVIYNSQARFAGSPYHQGFTTPTGPLCHYKWTLPDDDSALGETSFNKIHQPGNGAGDDTTIQREQVANSFLRALGVPWLNRRYVHVFVNGNRRGTLMEDTQCPDGDIVKQYFPDDQDGWLYKMQPWFEFSPGSGASSTGFENKSWATLNNYLSGGQKKVARYRYNYLIRRTPTSANDFTNVFSLIDAANSVSHPDYIARLETVADMENWMRVFAANHAAGNWDVFGARNSQNLYGYIGALGTRYTLLMWDFNIVLGNSGSWGPGVELFTVSGAGAPMQSIFGNPTFRRMYWRALEELVNGPLNPNLSGPLMDAKYAQFSANGISVESPQTIKSWVGSARSSIATQLAGENPVNFTVNAPTVSNNVAFFTGTAPVRAKTIAINGQPWPVRWIGVGTWSIAVPLQPGVNNLSITGVDRNGARLPGMTNYLNLDYTGPAARPQDDIAITEIMFAPLRPNTSFVEIYNTSPTTVHDLSGAELRGVGYTFPPGSLLGPGRFFTLAENPVQFVAHYGISNIVAGAFSGTLQNDGETLSLVAGTTSIVTRVRYSNALPWPTSTANTGRSIQLIDALEDNWRVANWAASPQAPLATPGQLNNLRADLPPFEPLWLNEVQVENLSGLTNSLGQRVPWIELFNPTTNTVTLDGLYLSPSPTNLAAWAFPAGAALGPKQFRLIFADAQPQLTTPTEYHANFTLPARGTLLLSRTHQGANQVLDYLDYASPGSDRSYGSAPDAQSFARQAFYYATPGASNNPATPPIRVRINEWMADNFATLADPADTNFEDWFELYNAGTEPADLSGYYLTDTALNKYQSLIPANHHYIIPPNGYLLVWADGERAQNSTNLADLHVNFKLDRLGDGIALYAPDGTLVDAVSFATQTTDATEGRIPNGGTQILKLPVPSPRAPNIVDNAPPWITPTPWRMVILGQTLRLPVSAGDPDAPAQQITFSLLSAPPGAAINPVTGEFYWQPSFAPQTNLFSIVVRDNGVPSLTATQSLVVVTIPAPAVAAFAISPSQLVLQIPTVAGMSYKMQYKDALDDPDWLDLGPPIIGTGYTISITNAVSTEPQRYLRLAFPALP